jgi:hypothetical protein
MAREAIAIDLDPIEMPELARLAQEVRRTRTPILLRADGEDVAVLSPAKSKRRPSGKRITQADIDAAIGAIGSWEGIVDTERLKRELDEARSDNSPPVEL